MHISPLNLKFLTGKEVSKMKENKNNGLKADILKAVAGGKFTYTLKEVKEMGKKAVDALILARKEKNPYDQKILISAAKELSETYNAMINTFAREASEKKLKSQGWEIM